MFVLIRPEGDVHDLVGFEHAGARILRVGTGAAEHVEIHRRQAPVVHYPDLGAYAVFARVNVGTERFEAVGDEFYRPAQFYRGGRRRDLIAEGMDLETEGPADVGGDQAYVVLGDSEGPREDRLDHVRALA